ncbi:MAG: hypothetical protein CSB47_00925 [Proteobacteria bacterium]|nr:MAG: hypothetical protein CSB47_00925 [Pseudomonadota bacterium]
MRQFAVKQMNLPRKLAVVASALLFSSTSCFASGGAYHYRLDLTARLVTTSEGELVGVQMSWLYDPNLSATLMDGEDLSEAKRDATLKRRAADILDGLKGVGYFTTLKIDGQALATAEVSEYKLALNKQSRLQLNLTLPLTSPAPVKGHVLEVIVSDASAVGLATFVDPTHLKLEEPLKSHCQTPQLQQSQVGVIDGHSIITETMTVDCR